MFTSYSRSLEYDVNIYFNHLQNVRLSNKHRAYKKCMFTSYSIEDTDPNRNVAVDKIPANFAMLQSAL